MGVSKTKTSKTQNSDPKNSDPLGVSKTQTPWLLYLNQILCTIRFWVLLNIHKQLAESNFRLTLALLLVLLGILCELFSIYRNRVQIKATHVAYVLVMVASSYYYCCRSRLSRNGISFHGL